MNPQPGNIKDEKITLVLRGADGRVKDRYVLIRPSSRSRCSRPEVNRRKEAHDDRG